MSVLVVLGLMTAALWAGPVAARQEAGPAAGVDEVLSRLEELSLRLGTDRLGWRVFSRSGGRNYTQEFGLEFLGRFDRNEGVRTMVTLLGCADATAHPRRAGPNHLVVIHRRDSVTVVPSMLLIESPDPWASFPYLALQSGKGEPGHDEVEPTLVPWTTENLLVVQEPLLSFQLAPRLMFGHEPGLRVAGRAPFQGRECIVLVSERNGEPRARVIPEWSALVRLRKRFFIDPSTWLIQGMEWDLSYASPDPGGAVRRELWACEVKKRRPFRRAGTEGPSLDLPEETEMRDVLGADAHGTLVSSPRVIRTIEFQTDDFP